MNQREGVQFYPLFLLIAKKGEEEIKSECILVNICPTWAIPDFYTPSAAPIMSRPPPPTYLLPQRGGLTPMGMRSLDLAVSRLFEAGISSQKVASDVLGGWDQPQTPGIKKERCVMHVDKRGYREAQYCVSFDRLPNGLVGRVHLLEEKFLLTQNLFFNLNKSLPSRTRNIP